MQQLKNHLVSESRLSWLLCADLGFLSLQICCQLYQVCFCPGLTSICSACTALSSTSSTGRWCMLSSQDSCSAAETASAVMLSFLVSLFAFDACVANTWYLATLRGVQCCMYPRIICMRLSCLSLCRILSTWKRIFKFVSRRGTNLAVQIWITWVCLDS